MALSTAVLAKLAGPVQKSSGALKEAAIDRAFNNAFSMGVALMVNADMTRLAQAFVNLLNNAAKYSERGGRIRLNVGKLRVRSFIDAFRCQTFQVLQLINRCGRAQQTSILIQFKMI